MSGGNDTIEEDGLTHQAACLNCNTMLIGAHCHSCGQKAQVHRTLRAFLHDLMHGALHFEGKIWRTLPLLIRKPGELTRRYIDGQRARFVSPMAMFLFSVFLMFAVFQMLGISAPSDISDDETIAVNGQLEVDGDIDGEDVVPPEEAESAEESDESSGVAFIDSLAEKWQNNPGLMLYKMQANSYKFSWLLIPLSIPFVWLLFAWKRRFRAYDHAIFVTYSLTFMTLLFVAVTLLGAIGVASGLLIPATLIIAPIHIYKQLRSTYDLSRFSAFWRLVFLLLFGIVIVALFISVLLMLGAF